MSVGNMLVSEIPLGSLHAALLKAYNAGPMPVMIWGPPGIAKSAKVRHFASQLNLPLYDIRLPLYDVVDIKGIPMIAKVTNNVDGKEDTRHVTRFFSPDFLPTGPAVIFFDEIANAAPAVQTAAQRIILDRSCDGGWSAHPKTIMLAASNRKTDRTGVNSMPAALDNRFIHLEVIKDDEHWLDWLLSTYSAQHSEREAASLVYAFLKSDPSAAYSFKPEDLAKGQHGYPTYRSWETVVKLLIQDITTDNSLNELDKSTSALVKGSIGVPTGHTFDAFVRLRKNMPDIDGIFAGKPWTVPSAPDIKYATIGAISARVRDKKSAATMWTAVQKFEKADSADFAMCMVRMVIRIYPDISKMNEFLDWADKHKGLIGLGGK